MAFPSNHRERISSVAVFMLAWKFLTNNKSPGILIEIVTSHHHLKQKKRHNYSKMTAGTSVWQCVKIKVQQFLVKASQSFYAKTCPTQYLPLYIYATIIPSLIVIRGMKSTFLQWIQYCRQVTTTIEITIDSCNAVHHWAVHTNPHRFYSFN